MEKKNLETESSLQKITPEDEKQINDTLLYEKWRDEGKADHKKCDIEKKIKKANAAKKNNTMEADDINKNVT